MNNLHSKYALIVFPLLLVFYAQSQFAPAAGLPGSTAIHKDSSIIVAWATGCEIQRGFRQINLPDSGYAAFGSPASALGKAGENGVVSLGDGGIATLTFSTPITNGPGADFCVFENAFIDSFLELGFVEVSSDGNHFVRFAAISHTQDTLQTDPFGFTRPEKIHNLAGKYRALYGTPFDLDELKDSSGVDVSAITHIRIIDVVGSIDGQYATYDVNGNKINDPFPTNFPTGGFDLDAVGVIHQLPLSVSANSDFVISCYPNPFDDYLTCHSVVETQCAVINNLGQILYTSPTPTKHHIIPANLWPAGTYHLLLTTNSNLFGIKVIKK